MARRKYRVCGTSRVFGNEPGSTFMRELDPAHERRLIEAGSIARVAKTRPPKAPQGARAATKPQDEGGTNGG